MAKAVQIGLVAFHRRGEVHPVQAGVVEEVPLHPPDLAVHLPPLGAGIDQDLDAVEGQGPLARLGRLGGRHDAPARPLVDEHLLAVLRHGEGRLDPLEDLLRLARFEVEPVQDGALEAEARHGRALEHEHHALLADGEARVVARRNRQGQDPLSDAVEVDLHGSRLVLLILILVVLAVLPLLLLVALGGQGRRQLLVQHGHVHAARDRPLEARQVEPSGGGADVRAGREVEVLAPLVEGPVARVAQAVRDLAAFAGLRRVEEDGPQVVAQVPAIGDPAAVGRPGDLERTEGRLVAIVVDPHGLALLDVDVPEVQALVGVGDLRAVRRPLGE